MSWLNRGGWKTMLAIIYAVICVYDFIVVPVWFGIVRATIDIDHMVLQMQAFDPSVQMKIIEAYTFQHSPFTLQGGGLFHLAFGALLTGSAITQNKG